jgi:hypothetical protein
MKGATTFCIVTITITTLIVTPNIKDTDPYDTRHKHIPECCYAKCPIFVLLLLNVVMWSVVMLSVVAPNEHSLVLHFKENSQICD